MRTKQPKKMLTGRVAPVVKEIIRAERGSMSDGEFIEQLVVRNVRTKKGRELLTRWADANPLVQAIANALPKPMLGVNN